MTATHPTDFRFVAELPPARPLVPLEVARFYLDTDSAGVIRRMEDGLISPAWDIGLGLEKRELRFYWRSLAAAKRAQDPSLKAAPLPHDEAVYADIIPTNWQRPRASLLYRRWDCSHDLLADLIAAGKLQAITKAHRGESGSPEILRDSAISFLQSRRCT